MKSYMKQCPDMSVLIIFKHHELCTILSNSKIANINKRGIRKRSIGLQICQN